MWTRTFSENYIKMATDPLYNSCFQHDPRPRQAFDSYMMQMGHDQPTQKRSALCKMRIIFSWVGTKKTKTMTKKTFIFSMLINFLIHLLFYYSNLEIFISVWKLNTNKKTELGWSINLGLLQTLTPVCLKNLQCIVNV